MASGGEQCWAALDALRVRDLPSAWVAAIWDSNFCDMTVSWPLDGDIGDEEDKNLQALSSGLLELKGSAPVQQDPQTFWLQLVEHNTSHRAIIAALYYFMENGGSNPNTSILAARAYLLLAQMPGSAAHKVHNMMLLRRVASLLARWPEDNGTAGALTGTQKEGGKRKGRSPSAAERKFKARRGRVSDPSEAMEADDDAEGESHSGNASAQAIGRPRPALLAMLGTLQVFVQFLRAHPLRDQPDVLEPVAQVLMDITRMPTLGDMTADELCQELAAAHPSASPAALAYQGLQALCTGPPSAEMDTCLQMVLRHLLASVLMKFQGLSATTSIPKQITAVRNHALAFICHMFKNGVGLHMARTLVHHLCLGVADRAEYRARTAEAVTDVWLVLPSADAASLLPWLQKLSRNHKTSCRGFALDVALELLQRPTTQSDDNAMAILLDMLVSRSSDKGPTVRARALSAFGTIADACRESGCASLLAAVEHAAFTAAVATPASAPAAPEAGDGNMLLLVRHRTADARGAVRKAALAALAALVQLPGYVFDRRDVKCIHERCRDTVLSVRRQAMLSLTELLHVFPTQADMQSLWLDGVMPLAIDREDTVKSKAIELIADMTLHAIMDTTSAPLAWALIDILDRRQEMRCYLQRCCTEWSQKSMLTKALVSAVTTRVCADNSGWTLLAELAARSPKQVDSSKVFDAWARARHSDGACGAAALTVLGSLALPATAARKLCSDLMADVKSFSLPASMIGVALSVIGKLKDGSADDTSDFFEHLLADVESQLASAVLHAGGDGMGDDDLARRLFTLGDVALLCPGRLTERSKLVLQAIVADSNSERCSVRAHSFLALGKLSLQDEALAKQSLPAMSRELQDGSDPAARNNIVVVMSDLCVRYAALLEPHVSSMAACLRDPSPLVRRQTLMLLTRLLCEDYLKLKGSLFFRLAAAMADPDDSVAALASFCLTESLHSKDATLFVSHLVECVFHFNGCNAHSTFNQFAQTEREMELFSLAGEDCRRQRMRIYCLMLQHCTDQDKLQLTHSLCQDVLGAVVDGTLSLEAADTIADALAILASKDMKLRAHRCAAADSDMEDDAPLTKATATLITKIAKKHLVQHIMPIIIELKSVLERAHSPLLKGLMAYLREVLRDFKDETEDILAADRQLATEILFDLQQFEQRRVGSTAATPVSATPGSARPLVTPGTPFSAPRLRSSMGSAVSVTPLRSMPQTANPHTPRPSALAWVRTPGGKPAAACDDDIIHLKTPLQPLRAQPPAPESPTFDTAAAGAAGRPRRSTRQR